MGMTDPFAQAKFPLINAFQYILEERFQKCMSDLPKNNVVL